MDTHAQTQTFSLTSGGLGKKNQKREWTAVMRKRESWPFIIRRGFTEGQRKELHEQAVIHRHISAGLQVPLYLVLPLLKTVVSSLGPISFQNQYPSLLKCGKMTEEEPGRCRRTDGKKWRCRRDVILGQKYCEAHIHRGRQRSRKLVEQALSPPLFAAPIIPPKPKPQLPPCHHHRPNPTPPVSVGLQLMTTLSPAHVGVTSGAVIKLKKPRGSGFSPKSVLQGSQLGVAMGASRGGDGEVAAGDWRRCRRTDGKKWRCRREVVPEQKYCQSHMHRGAKKQPRVDPPDTSLCISIRHPGPAPVEEEESSSSDTTITDTSN